MELVKLHGEPEEEGNRFEGAAVAAGYGTDGGDEHDGTKWVRGIS